MPFVAAKGLSVTIHDGASVATPNGAIVVDVGGRVPSSFSGLRRVLRALEDLAPRAAQTARAHARAEWAFLFPDASLDENALFHLADAPNQRRLFRESEQVFRVLNASAHVMLAALREAGRPLVLRNAGACDLPSLRGLMHAVECSRFSNVGQEVHLCDWSVSSKGAPTSFRATRATQLEQLSTRMRANHETGRGGAISVYDERAAADGVEARHLASVTDESGSREHRIAAALLAIRACFFSTNYEGARLAADIGLALLADGSPVDQSAIRAAWDREDDAKFDVPMIELDRASIGDSAHLTALFRLHIAITQAFTRDAGAALSTLALALESASSKEMISDLRMYRSVIYTKRLGQLDLAKAEIELGLDALAGKRREETRVREAWLRNLYALVHFQDKSFAEAEGQEALAIAAIDDVPGDSATHLKTNLISNFSVLYEAKGDYETAIGIWRGFETLNRKIGSARADKVYRHRLGALLRASGQREAALESLLVAHALADADGDRFHGESIAASIARMFLDADTASGRADAARWFSAAAESALVCGDAVQLAADFSGCGLAGKERAFDDARAALSCNSTYALEREPLPKALLANDKTAIGLALATSRTKMSRPFDLVNL